MKEGAPTQASKVERKERPAETLSVSEIVVRLGHVTLEEIEEWPLRFTVRLPVSAEELRLLPSLPIEVSIVQREGNLILSTGTDGTALHEWDKDNFKEMIEGPLSMHSHNGATAGILHCPSTPDLHAAISRSEAAGYDIFNTVPSMIIAEKGVMLYALSDEAAFSLMFFEAHLAEMQKGKSSGIEESIDSISPEFAKELGNEMRSFLSRLDKDEPEAVIWRDVRWEDAKTISYLIDFLNGSKDWNEVGHEIYFHKNKP